MRRLTALVLSVCLIISACSSGAESEGTLLVNISSAPGSIGTGIQRVMFAVVDLETQEFVGSPFDDAIVTLRDENGAPMETLEADFLWLIPNVRGLYVMYPDLPEPGLYQITVKFGSSELGPFGLNAFADPAVVGRGDPAPLSETRTSADHEISEISSDPEPDASFYALSIHQAVQAGPTVVVFATPKWCRTATCGPLLDQVKDLAPAFPDINFLHVEVYEDLDVSSFEELVAVEAVDDWSLPSEPWVFVINNEGVVTASFEGAASGEELVAAFSAVGP